ncbi:MAG: imidazoleglycerol-phosphate dehydratase [Clostridiales bacterium GWB2_37_7]|nr:MAG: imidazoleglycerol-phosphate dehydratase [Clostridiales bacterium GWB2_37_7]
MPRITELNRITNETNISLYLNVDGTGKYEIDTGCGFFDHMLAQLSRHGMFDINIKAKGDLIIDSHHTVEDVGIVLGRAFAECLGDKNGIARYGSMLIPMDESLCMTAVDICGRSNLIFNGEINGVMGTMDSELIYDFLKAFTDNSGITLHVNIMYGRNNHHKAEGVFKGVARALREAVKIGEANDVPTTKGCL